MPVPMSPTSSIFLLGETRQRPMHVGGLQLFRPPEGASAVDMRAMFTDCETVAPLFRKRPRRSLASLGQWAWAPDPQFDIEHHVRVNALPQPGRVRELLALCSRLHATLLDRHRPLWETHLVEGLADGRFAVYFKIHHSMVDGVHALRLLSRALSEDASERGLPAPWASREDEARAGNGRADAPPPATPSLAGVPPSDPAVLLGQFGQWAREGLGIVPAVARTVRRALNEQSAALSFSAPRTIFNVPITGARRFAAQSWPLERIRRVARGAGVTVNDVVLAMCSGALRAYLGELGELPDSALIAMVPVSLHPADGNGDGGGNALGLVMCNLGTHLADPAARLAAVHRSMREGKQFMSGLSPLQILATSALGISALGIYPLLHLDGLARPPFNVVISNVPGPAKPLFWNGARLDGIYPLSIPTDGQALNITCTSYADQLAFGLTGCRRTVPHLQRLLDHLDDSLDALEVASDSA